MTCAIALAIAEDREKDSNLFIKDAKNAVPSTGAASLLDMTVSDWEKQMGFTVSKV